MTTSSGPSGSGGFDPSSPLVGAAIGALPPEIQALIQPGKTSDRIQHAISWASRRDPAVLRRHQARNPRIQTFEDIASAPLHQMDAVANEIAASYRRRAAMTGAVTGLPGGLWAFVGAGADVQLTAVYAVRMAAQVAQAYGYDTSDLTEQAHLADVLALMAGVDTLRGVGNYLTREGLAHYIPMVLPKLLARLSVEITEDQAAKWAGRLIPGLGAAVAGAIDYSFLRAAGQKAVAYYHNRYLSEHGLAAPAAQAVLPPGQGGRVVEGSVAAPALPVGAQAQAAPMVPAAPRAVMPAAQPMPLPRKHAKPPERLFRSLALFSLFFFIVTLLACGALAVLAVHGLQSINVLPH